MDHVLQIAVGTVTMRPYVFAFLAAYLAAAVMHLGWRTTLMFTVVGYFISFASEVSSINTGFPYGWYYYIDATKDRELWIAGVPFFDSLSYVFLAYCSYATALLAVCPVRAWRGGLVTLETRSIRKSFSVLLLASLFQVFLDIVIDPIALQGNRWFLGQIYGYREAVVHFGVPLSNYIGWLVTSICLVLALQIIDAMVGKRPDRPPGVRNFRFRALLGPLLYLSVLVFNLVISYVIGERLMVTTGMFMFILPAAIVITGVVRRTNRYSREELAEHLRDFPWSPGSGKGLHT